MSFPETDSTLSGKKAAESTAAETGGVRDGQNQSICCQQIYIKVLPSCTPSRRKRTAKRIRKYNGSLWIISQNLIDFTSQGIERFGQVIIDNSSYILVMAQGQKEIEAVQKMMNLSESEIQFLTTASRGQGLFVISQDTRLPIQIHLREEEKDLFGNAGGR